MDKKILFDLHRMNAQLADGVENFSNDTSKYCLPILFLDEDLIFVTATDKDSDVNNLENWINLYTNEFDLPFKINLNNYYRIGVNTFLENAHNVQQPLFQMPLSEFNELQILDTVNVILSDDENKVKLIYIQQRYKENINQTV
ncbi:hypothetical protein GE118_01390 [Mycoplasma sp. NEAQ87857]|uniref:hypothetical protein n=1 Tax=Mycoplasma sp. NEAQ87857 TaxID=2683967 RepID=UPI0013184A8E|nr:hypothetical protein [Mycoplasma sp. NEAQ87857]QGZ97448.1 hypothetical protein GE118_01390 [Mycoplasma sp. NEAQ87857]